MTENKELLNSISTFFFASCNAPQLSQGEMQNLPTFMARQRHHVIAYGSDDPTSPFRHLILGVAHYAWRDQEKGAYPTSFSISSGRGALCYLAVKEWKVMPSSVLFY
ncbi:hypothetical protein CEXT_151041 [Caerostris extrusa]|uniref:Uncharacterized protein n=1 Tax=Caerostris extrusa TaxID=172846 RepID=A0AAV4XSP6_CAEEX|nr:hypothetical protein CEXT_151041 [Caerostris extrusa]